ncbi:hypothetical protein H9I48_03110 [Wolbachia pipientis]|uniref:hypothetical protein n=1 Tax=Wolbachia pipientis TaxID=955 RepID=UPI0016519E3B|nr:hypothetical protein [Wolbachia pipientis]MBC6686221.1 hypothetical protein [Wolbachia pipientis]
MTLESSLYYAATYLNKFPGSQCLGTGMTLKGLLLSWMETSVSYSDDTLTTVIPLLVSGI